MYIDIRLLAISVLCLLLSASSHAVTLYVSPSGNDSWTGTLSRPDSAKTDGPLATMEGAQKIIRDMRRLKIVQEPAEVVFMSGRYPVAKPVEFTWLDSGSPDAPITYKAAKGASVWFDGGKRITGFNVGADGIWRVKLPEVAEGKWYFEQLWVNGKRAMRARTPNNSTLQMVFTPSDETGNADWAPLTPEDAKPLKTLSKDALKDLQFVIYESWERSRHRITNIDSDNIAHLSMRPAISMSFGGPHARYHYENARICLDAPGEWFLDRSGELCYIPLPGQKPTNTEIIAPVADSFISLKGDREKNQVITDIKFDGLKFAHAQWLTPEKGYADAQAAFNVPAVITADGCEDVSFTNCEIAHIGSYALWMRQGCRNCVIQRNYIHDMGAGGVRVGVSGVPSAAYQKSGYETGYIKVDNNIIRQGGQIHMDGIGVWVGECGNISITHNEIADLYYTGISVGWVWGYGPTATANNLIEDNHIHHIGKGVLSDMAGIYTLGIAPGSITRGNRIHDVRRWSYGGSGIYPDEGSSGWLIENNVVYNVDDGGLFHHYGKENMVRNNIFVDSTYTQVFLGRVEEHLSFWFQNNIICYKQGSLLSDNLVNANTSFNNNLYWQRDKLPIKCGTLSYDQWKAKGQDKDSLIADPLFVDINKHDFRLKPNSPALKVGFKPFALDKAGVYGDASWRKLAASGPVPQSELSADESLVSSLGTTPISIHETYDNYGSMKYPANVEMQVEGKPELITLTTEQAHSGTKCVKILDQAGLQADYTPHMVYRPGQRDTELVCRFALMTDERTNFMVELRDWVTDPTHFVTGPMLSIKNGVVTAGDKMINIPHNKWVVYEMRAGVGKLYKNNWRLTVTPDGDKATTLAVPCKAAALPIVSWVGFISYATQPAVVYLDDVTIEPVKSVKGSTH